MEAPRVIQYRVKLNLYEFSWDVRGGDGANLRGISLARKVLEGNWSKTEDWKKWESAFPRASLQRWYIPLTWPIFPVAANRSWRRKPLWSETFHQVIARADLQH